MTYSFAVRLSFVVEVPFPSVGCTSAVQWESVAPVSLLSLVSLTLVNNTLQGYNSKLKAHVFSCLAPIFDALRSLT